MIIKELADDLSVIQVDTIQNINFSITPLFIGKTESEISVVLPTMFVPAEVINREDGWKGITFDGTLDFSLVGILAKIATLLAENSISIFAISTYNTDYILIKKDSFKLAKKVLIQAGYDLH